MVEIMALLMFVGAEQKLTEMTYMPSVKKCIEKKLGFYRYFGAGSIPLFSSLLTLY